MGLQDIIDNHEMYSTKYLNNYLFDVDEELTRNKYYLERKKYYFKKGKYENVTYYMMTIMYPTKKFTKWFVENGSIDEEHRNYLKSMLKRQELNHIIDTRIKFGQFKGLQEFEL